jgi:ribonuclease D
VTDAEHVPRVIVADSPRAIAELARTIARAHVLPIDVESNGLHAYRASLCTLQIGVVEGEGAVTEVHVVDPIVASSSKEAGGASIDDVLAPLREVLCATGPRKILHDLAFDARILSKHGLPLGNVFDTSLAARFLGTTSTSLAAIVQARLGVALSKELQQHDWGKRPLDASSLPYLAADVAHLPAIARALEDEISSKGIAPELEAETAWRLSTAIAARDDDDPRPPWARIKGMQELDPLALATLRRLADVRETAARKWNVPPFKVLGNETLITLAKKRPKGAQEIRAVRGLDRGRGAALVGELFSAIQRGARDGDIPADERASFVTPAPQPPREQIEARRAREHRLTAWRRAEAKRRGVDEQVVLPGHCLQELADRAPATAEELATIGGIGRVRVERDTDAILSALRGPSNDPPKDQSSAS